MMPNIHSAPRGIELGQAPLIDKLTWDREEADESSTQDSGELNQARRRSSEPFIQQSSSSTKEESYMKIG